MQVMPPDWHVKYPVGQSYNEKQNDILKYHVVLDKNKITLREIARKRHEMTRNTLESIQAMQYLTYGHNGRYKSLHLCSDIQFISQDYH